MTNVMIEGSNNQQIIGTMGISGTLSEEYDLSGFTQIGLLTDGAANGTLNFLVSLVAGTVNDSYRLLRDNAGAAYALTVPTGRGAFKESDMRVLAPYRYVRILSSVSQTGFSATFVLKA